MFIQQLLVLMLNNKLPYSLGFQNFNSIQVKLRGDGKKYFVFLHIPYALNQQDYKVRLIGYFRYNWK